VAVETVMSGDSGDSDNSDGDSGGRGSGDSETVVTAGAVGDHGKWPWVL
jgi:hypothetical protein